MGEARTLVATMLCALALGGCGAAKASADAAQPSSAGAAEKAQGQVVASDDAGASEDEEFERAAAELDELFGGPEEVTPGGQPGEATPLVAANRCDQACRALETMRRAADRVCGLEPGGERCDNVRTRTDKARDRVKASCPSCAAANE